MSPYVFLTFVAPLIVLLVALGALIVVKIASKRFDRREQELLALIAKERNADV